MAMDEPRHPHPQLCIAGFVLCLAPCAVHECQEPASGALDRCPNVLGKRRGAQIIRMRQS